MTAVLARRFTIISLILAIFAMLFALGARENNLQKRNYLSGHLFICSTGAEAICNISDLEGARK